jgi:tetratricopeptide (TPR) repeat protein
VKSNKRTARAASQSNSGTGGRSVIIRHALSLAAAIGFAFLAYSNSFQTPLLLDNSEMILKDSRVHEATAAQVHRILHEQYWETAFTGLYRPLTTLSFLFNYAVLGDGATPEGYHWLNFQLHAVNIALVYALGLVLFDAIPPALILSLLWGVHPVLTESVTNIVGRADMLAAFGVLAGLLCYRKVLQTSGLRQAAWLAAAACAVAIGTFSKEGAIVVIGAAALYDLAFRPPAPVKSRILAYAAICLPCIFYLYVRAGVLAATPYLATQFTDNPLLGTDFLTARLTAVKVLGQYLMVLLWPARLSADHSYNQIPLFNGLTNWEGLKTAASLVITLLILGLSVRFYKTNRPAFFATLFFFVAIAPVANIFILIGSPMAERFLYLPSIGFVAAAVCGGIALWRRFPALQTEYRNAARIAFALVAIALAGRAFARNTDWQDVQRFWQSMVEASPHSFRAQIGAALNTIPATQSDWDRSILHADAALAILDPLPDTQNAPGAYLDAGSLYRRFGQAVAAGKASGGTAESWYRKSLATLLRADRIERLIDDRYRRDNALRGKPGLIGYPMTYYVELGRTYLQLAQPQQAIATLQRGRMQESDPDLLEDLSTAYRQAGDIHNAALAAVEAVAVDPSRVNRLTPLLADLYQQIDTQACAATRQGGQVSLNWNCAIVHADICAASRNVAANYQRRGQLSDAASIRRTAVQDLGCAAELVQ